MDERETEPGESLINLFDAAESEAIRWPGVEVRQSFRLPVNGDTLLQIDFVRAVKDPVQALAIVASAASLEIGGAGGSQMMLWRDTAPERILAKVSPRGEQAEVVFWNEWRPADGTVESAWGNAGIVAEDQ